MATEVQAERLTLPRLFRADLRYSLALVVATLLGALGGAYISRHLPQMAVVIWAMTGLYLLMLVTILSLQIQASEDALTQRWLFSRAVVPWKQITRVDRTARWYALLDKNNKEPILLRFLARADQQFLAEEAIKRARLKKSSEPLKLPAVEQWTRK